MFTNLAKELGHQPVQSTDICTEKNIAWRLDVLARFLQPFCLIEIKDQGAEEDIGPESQRWQPNDGFSSPQCKGEHGDFFGQTMGF